MQKIKIQWIVLCGLVFIGLTCRQTTEPLPKYGFGFIRGTIKTGGTLLRGFVFWNDSLLATSGSDGTFAIEKMKAGEYSLTASALNYGDTTQSVEVKSGETTDVVFELKPDSRTGKIFGEFQDAAWFRQSTLQDTTLLHWDEKQVFDGGTGATLQAKTFGPELPDRMVFLDDSLLAFADAWGQYGITMPRGTYPLTGACEGYKSQTRVVKVPPNGRVYLNFYLWKL